MLKSAAAISLRSMKGWEMSRRDRIARNRHADFVSDVVCEIRRCADEGLGFNCTFVDDDMRVIVGLAQRAVLAGLVSDFTADMQRRFTTAAEKHRADHEKALGFEILHARAA